MCNPGERDTSSIESMLLFVAATLDNKCQQALCTSLAFVCLYPYSMSMTAFLTVVVVKTVFARSYSN